MSSIVNLKKPKIVRGIREPHSTLIAVGGGKGGIGKSFISSNLGIFLATMGYKTVVVDLDLGATNLHTCLGEELPQQGIHNFLSQSEKDIKPYITSTNIPNLQLLSGISNYGLLTNLSVQKQSQLMSAIFNLEADYVILDLSAGSHPLTLDFFLMAQLKLIAFTPEPTCIENAYTFMKESFYRCISRYENQLDLKIPVARLKTNANQFGVRYPADFLSVLSQQEPDKAQKLMKILSHLDFKIIVNQARTQNDFNLGFSIKSVSTKYFGLPASYLGALDFDNAVWQSMRKKRPLVLESPQSPIYAQVMGIARQIAATSPKASNVSA